MLLYKLNDPEFIFLRDNGVDSFLYEPVTHTYYLLYWDGSIYNHGHNSCATFMNWRADGLSVKHVIEYKIYTQLTVSFIFDYYIIFT